MPSLSGFRKCFAMIEVSEVSSEFDINHFHSKLIRCRSIGQNACVPCTIIMHGTH